MKKPGFDARLFHVRREIQGGFGAVVPGFCGKPRAPGMASQKFMAQNRAPEPQILRLTTPKLKDVWVLVRPGWQRIYDANFRDRTLECLAITRALALSLSDGLRACAASPSIPSGRSFCGA
jgi:hypothetical protein